MNVDKYRDALHKIQSRVDRALKDKKRYVIYSAYALDANDIPKSNLSTIAALGEITVTYGGDSFFGNGKTYTRKLKNPSFLKLAIVANEAIAYTEDFHHIFFEGIRKNSDGTFHLVMGS